MSPFEIFFGLTAVILGLALTELAGSLAKLLRAGRRVMWAPEPILQAFLILLILVFVWSNQWQAHAETSFTVLQAILQVLKMLALYVAAASVLGEPEATRTVDMREHYYAARPTTYGAMVVGLILFTSYAFMFNSEHLPLTLTNLASSLVLPAVYGALIFIHWRPLHIGALIILNAGYLYEIAAVTIR